MFDLDVITQIIILLGAICNIVVGLRTEVCEFIINTAVLLVWLAMDTGWTPGQRLEASCNAHQEFILKQLPTSLYTALGRFDIEGESTLYAACPTCNCTYEPHYDPISTSSSYPLQCHNCLLGTHGPYICNAPLLEEPSSDQLHPLKPFLVTSFHKHLVKLLSNKDIEDAIDLACSAALSSLDEDGDERPTNNPFDAEFLRT